MSNNVMIYYTECRHGKDRVHYAIQAESEDAYFEIIDDCREQDPTMQFGEYQLFTPKEYSDFLKGY